METLAKYEAPTDVSLTQLGDIFTKSGFFPDIKTAAQAVTKIMAGQACGFDPFTSMSNIHIIQGRLEMGAHLHANAVKRSPRYDYEVIKHTDEVCEIAFFELSKRTGSWRQVGVSSFSQADAQRAGLTGGGKMYGKYPKNMLFARAMTNGVEFYAPDVFQARIYAEGEISGEFVTETEPTNPTPPQVESEPVSQESMTEKQEALICKLLLSSVWTAEEKAKAEKWLAASPSKEAASKFADSLLSKIQERKKAAAGNGTDALDYVKSLLKAEGEAMRAEFTLGVDAEDIQVVLQDMNKMDAWKLIENAQERLSNLGETWIDPEKLSVYWQEGEASPNAKFDEVVTLLKQAFLTW